MLNRREMFAHSAKVATLMHRHHGCTEAARARTEALAEIEAAQARCRVGCERAGNFGQSL